jgi:SAM-dependent methyltransferase
MTMLDERANTTPAGERWRAMLQAREEQSQRLRDRQWQPPVDVWTSNVESFRAGRGRSDDLAVVEALQPLLRPGDVFVDVGAGAGRFALPLAPQVHEMIAIEPSRAMSEALTADVQRAGLTNTRLVASRWQEVSALRGDVVFSAHALYRLAEIERFLHWMTAAARRWAGILLFAEAPLFWLAPFWPLVHGEPRAPSPHLPQLLEVNEDLGLGQVEIREIEAEPFPLGPADLALAKLRRRLQVAPSSAADERLKGAMQDLLEERQGVLEFRGTPTIKLGLVRWATDG